MLYPVPMAMPQVLYPMPPVQTWAPVQPLHPPQAVPDTPSTEAWIDDLPSREEVKQTAVTNLLARTSTIRIGVEHARGRGSVAAFVYAVDEIVRQIRRNPEGARPALQVVYREGAQANLRFVLGTRFNPDHPRQTVSLRGEKILFVKEGHLQGQDNRGGPHPIIGFVAANDGPDNHASQWLDSLSDDAAGDVAAVAVGQPYGWTYGGGKSLQYRANGVPAQSFLTDIADGYAFRVARFSRAELSEELEAGPDGTRTRSPARLALASVFRKLDRGAIDVMPIYGLHHPQMQKAPDSESALIRNLCGGIREARERGLPTRPTVLVVLGEYEGEMRPFSRIGSPDDPADVAYANEGPHLDKLYRMSGGDILLLYAGDVPERFFQQVIRWSTLPPVVEGANTANLCQNLENKPYLHMSLGGTDFIEVPDARSGRNVARNMSKDLEANRHDKRHAVRKDLGRFIAASRKPDSEVARYFKAVHDKTVNQNQVVDLLYHVAEMRDLGMNVRPLRQRWTRKSAGNVEYQLWSDGRLFFRRPNQRMRAFTFEGMVPVDAQGRKFEHAHRVLPRDLAVTDVTFASGGLFRRGNTGKTIIAAHKPGGASFSFELDERHDTVTLVGKNDAAVTRTTYRRDTARDGELGTNRFDGPAVLRKTTG